VVRSTPFLPVLGFLAVIPVDHLFPLWWAFGVFQKKDVKCPAALFTHINLTVFFNTHPTYADPSPALHTCKLNPPPPMQAHPTQTLCIAVFFTWYLTLVIPD